MTLDPLLLLCPLLLALLANRLGFPPLVGYLAAGFALYAMGVNDIPMLAPLADLGVLLLLFAIGLKLDVRRLFRKEVWASATLHLIGSITLTVAALKTFGWLGLTKFELLSGPQGLLLAFALSFSSTVFAIKVLQERGESVSFYGNTAIGILIIQDLFAVGYITISKGLWPSWWALLLLLLPLTRPLLYKIFDRVGHGDMLVLFGLCAALAPGAALFDAVGIKPDLGALVLGVLLAGHHKASELSRALFLFKELFLIAFFLNIGQQGLPTAEELMTALVLMALLPVKAGLFLVLLTRFRMRLRSAVMASLTLTNFSEFGLIVLAAAISIGTLDDSWLRILALLVAFSFLISAPLAIRSQEIYQLLRRWFTGLERHPLLPEDQPIHLGNPRVVVFGMGRIGTGAYDDLSESVDNQILGIDQKPEVVEAHLRAGRQVVLGDATDTDFWAKLEHADGLELVVLAMPFQRGNQFTVEQLTRINFKGQVGVICRWPDEAEELRKMGVAMVYDIYRSAGAGAAEQILAMMPKNPERAEPASKAAKTASAELTENLK